MGKIFAKISVPAIAASVAVAVIMVVVVRAQGPETKPYPEGQGAQATGKVESITLQGMKPGEGVAGSSGTGKLGEIGAASVSAANGLSLLYQFSGATDDGEQGSSSRKKATSVTCTNTEITSAQVEVQIIQWNGTEVYTGTVLMPAHTTFTFSTQNTTIYFDDVILGGTPGTSAIFQGSGRILSDHTHVVCTVQVLDPLNYPPVFMDKLTLFDKDGNLVGDIHKMYLPIILKS